GITVRDGQDNIGGGIRISGEGFNNISFLDFGKALTQANTSAVLGDVVVTENQALYEGGGIYAVGVDLILNNSQVTHNDTELFTGGGISMRGGGCFKCLKTIVGPPIIQGLLTLQNTTVSENNVGGVGGGIYNNTQMVIDSSTISGNTAGEDGGGIYDEYGASALITNSTISGNEALGEELPKLTFPDAKLAVIDGSGTGGGIFQGPFGELVLTNTTVSGNTALSSGGGIAVIGLLVAQAPALKMGDLNSTNLGLFNVTIANNTAQINQGGGVFLFQPQPVSTMKTAIVSLQTAVANTLIADNTADEGANDCLGGFTSLGYNLVGQADDFCTGFIGTGDQAGTPQAPIDPLLGPLQNNGGPTQTLGLGVSSPAIDTANPEGCLDGDGALLTRDQRNFARPVNLTNKPTAICDIGAFEAGNSLLKVVVSFVGPITTSQGTCSNAGETINCDFNEVPVGSTVTISFPVTAESPSKTVVNTVTVTSSTKDFEQAQTYTATVTTAVGGGLFEGSGCGIHAGPTSENAAWQTLLPLALCLGAAFATRLRRRNQE
ncbi:MAG: hypothetical protein K8R69_01105, partial [Deltaproteobacteria bacterium]|nr:hypothetical protein [Deltaproteobacteria bacterium]